MSGDACTACRAPVMPVITEAGAFRQLDLTPVEHGNVLITTQDDGRIRARVLTGTSGEPAEGAETYRMHRCPPPPRPGPPCSRCRLPMHRELAISLGWDTHPACEPWFADQREQATQLERARRARRRR